MELIEAITSFKQYPKEKKTISLITSRVEIARDLWDQFKVNHRELHKYDDKKAEEYINGSFFKTFENQYVDHISELKEELRMLIQSNEEERNITQASQLQAVQQKSEFKLPRISIPKFDGSYKSWRSFHDLFKSIIHKDPNLSGVQKLHYLKTSVTGEAERLLRQFEITDANYQKAWEFLDKRYNNKRVLVSTQLNLLTNQPSIKVESALAIKNLMYQTEESLHELNALKIDNWDAILVHILVQKLPRETHSLWEQQLGKKTDLPSYSELLEFLECRFRTLEALQEDKGYKSSNSTPQRAAQPITLLNNSPQCIKCKENHSLFHCPTFRKLQPPQRIDFATESNLCKNCLSHRHNSPSCQSKKTCLKCHKRHNTLLHLEIPPKPQQGYLETNPKPHNGTDMSSKSPPTQGSMNPEQSNNKVTSPQAFLSANIKKALLSTALIQVESTTGVAQTMRALIDSASQVSFMTETACKRLQLRRKPIEIDITGLGTTHTAHANSQVSFKIRSLHTPFETSTTALVLKKITDLIPAEPVSIANVSYFKNIPLADPRFHIPGSIDILLGADIYAQIISNGIIKGDEGDPTAQYTELGWILLGQTRDEKSSHSTISSFTIQVNSEQQLERQLQKFWELEEIPQSTSHPVNEGCEEIYRDTHERLSDGIYQVSLPFRNQNGPELGQSKHIAHTQSLQPGRRFHNEPQLITQNQQLIFRKSQWNHMQEIPCEQIRGSSKPNCTKVERQHLPHHAVIKDASTTKQQVVYNASAKTSFNELVRSPTIQSTLWVIRRRWRRYRCAFRGIHRWKLRARDIWCRGPTRLHAKSTEWPQQITVKSIELETKPFLGTEQDDKLLTKYSSFPNLLRIGSFCIRLYKKRKIKLKHRSSKFLTCQELRNAEIKPLSVPQKVTFSEEYNCLKSNKRIPTSHLLSLNTFLHETIHTGRRKSNLTINQKHHIPNIINDWNYSYTLHGGTIRNKYWLPNARYIIRNRIHQCIPGFRTIPKDSNQIASNLHAPHVDVSASFGHTGPNHAGPIEIGNIKTK